MNHTPAHISLVVPVRNGAPWLTECLDSALTQDIDGLELMVVDGGSTDGTLDIIKRYESRLAWWVSEPDRGLSHAINKALHRANGTWFNWLNADDRLRPRAFHRLLAHAASHPDLVFVGGRLHRMDEDGRPLEADNLKKNIDRPSPAAGLVDPRSSWLRLRTLEQPGGLFRREAVLAAGGLDENISTCMDQDLLLKLHFLGPLLQTNDLVIDFRKHHGQITANYQNRREHERFQIYRNLLARAPSGTFNAYDRYLMWKSALRYAETVARRADRRVHHGIYFGLRKLLP